MSSPSKRREMDLMKLYVFSKSFIFIFFSSFFSCIIAILVFLVLFSYWFWWVWNRMMSDYKVEMINDGMQEFFVDFNGPKESNSSEPIYMIDFLLTLFWAMRVLDWVLSNFDVFCSGFYPFFALNLCSCMLTLWSCFGSWIYLCFTYLVSELFRLAIGFDWTPTPKYAILVVGISLSFWINQFDYWCLFT